MKGDQHDIENRDERTAFCIVRTPKSYASVYIQRISYLYSLPSLISKSISINFVLSEVHEVNLTNITMDVVCLV